MHSDRASSNFQGQFSCLVILESLVFVSFFRQGFSVAPGWPQAGCSFKDNLELVILSLPALYWNYRCVIPHTVYGVLGFQSRLLCMLDKHCTN